MATLTEVFPWFEKSAGRARTLHNFCVVLCIVCFL